MEVRVGVPLSSWQVKRVRREKIKKRARQWEDQLELFTGFQHHVNFPLSGGNWKAWRRPYGSPSVGTTSQSDGRMLKVNHWCFKHFHMSSWWFCALWPSIAPDLAINHCATCLGRVKPFFVRIPLHQSKDDELMRRGNLKNCTKRMHKVNMSLRPAAQGWSFVSLLSFFLCVTFWGRRGLGEKNKMLRWDNLSTSRPLKGKSDLQMIRWTAPCCGRTPSFKNRREWMFLRRE